MLETIKERFMNPEIPVFGPKDFFIIEQLAMLNAYSWWSGVAFDNLHHLLTMVQSLVS